MAKPKLLCGLWPDVHLVMAKSVTLTYGAMMQQVPLAHPFANLEGSDNIISFRTRRYDENPLVIRGPGAGAEVTAAGVFGDLLNVVKMLSVL